VGFPFPPSATAYTDVDGTRQVDDDHPLLSREKELQLGQGERGDVTINPTVIINDRHYRGKLEATPLLKVRTTTTSPEPSNRSSEGQT
jgi:hypothetical protein